MILVYKFDFVFIQSIKPSLVDLPCGGFYKLCTQRAPVVERPGNQWRSASTWVRQSDVTYYKGVERSSLVHQSQEANMTQKLCR